MGVGHIEPSGAFSEDYLVEREKVLLAENRASVEAWHGGDAHEWVVPKGTGLWEALSWPCVPAGMLDFLKVAVRRVQGVPALRR